MSHLDGPFETFNFYLRMGQSAAAFLINLLPLAVVIKHKNLRDTAGITVASLSISDGLHGLVACILLPISSVTKASRVLRSVSQIFTTNAQLLSLTIVALERRNSLLAKLNRSKKWTVVQVGLALSAAWIVCTAWNVGFAMHGIYLTDESAIGIFELYPIYYFYCNISLVVLTILILVASYASIAKIAYSSAQQVASNIPESVQDREKRRADLRVTKMMALVIGVTFLLYVPVLSAYLFLPKVTSTWQHILQDITVLIHDMNFWMNPAIYVWRNKKFRRAICNLVPTCCLRTPIAVGQINAVSQNVQAQVVVPGPSGQTIRTGLVPRQDVIIDPHDLPQVQ